MYDYVVHLMIIFDVIFSFISGVSVKLHLQVMETGALCKVIVFCTLPSSYVRFLGKTPNGISAVCHDLSRPASFVGFCGRLSITG